MIIRSNLEKLKILPDSLVDRDFVRSKVVELFDTFCSDFPVQMNAWIVEKDLSIASKKGKSLSINYQDKKNLDEVFEGSARDKNLEMHKKAFQGESSVYIIEDNKSILLTKVMPANSSNDLVFGFSMDVTSFVKASDALEVHCKSIDDSTCNLLKEAREDSLYKIINEARENGK